MKIIDNRYRVEGVLGDKKHSDSYIISDLWEENKKYKLKLYNNNTHNDLIEYFQDNFIYLSTLVHDNLITTKKFNLIKTIDTKKTNMKLYYYLTEYIDGVKLIDIVDDLSLEERLKILLDIILAIDYLHFRGVTYKLLNPSNIYILRDRKVKIADMASIIEKGYYGDYSEVSRYFAAPEVIREDTNHIRADYYSIGILIKYLFFEDFFAKAGKGFHYKEKDAISTYGQENLNLIINKLLKMEVLDNSTNLKDVVDRIIEVFQLDYSYDLAKHRDKLHFESRIIGREKEISQILEFDDYMVNRQNPCKGVVVKADFGIGKSRYLREINRKLKFRGRDVYFIESYENKENNLMNMASILKQSIKDTPAEMLERYKGELSSLLPELQITIGEEMAGYLTEKGEKYRLYNRLANYFSELSKDKVIYIIIDDLQKCSENFISLIDYLVKNIRTNNIFFILSYEDIHGKSNKLIEDKLKEWFDYSIFKKIELHELSLEEVGSLVQSILGMSFTPHRISSELFKESNGNPRYIEYIIKHLYNIGEIYINDQGRWYAKVDRFSDFYFPADIDDAFKKQVDMVKEKHFDICKIMSIFEDVLYKETLIKILDIDKNDLEPQLEELKALKLIDEKVADWGYSYNISSSELKKIIYNEIPGEEKIELHKKAAKYIEKEYEDDIDTILDELLYHLIKSNQIDKSIKLILDKVERLDNKYGSYARLLLEKAYGLIKDIDNKEKLSILSKIVEIYSLRGELEVDNYYLEEYRGEAKRLEDQWHIIKGENALLDIYYLQGENDAALDVWKEIERISEDKNIIEGKIIALALKARFGIRTNQLEEAIEDLTKAIELSEKHEINTYLGVIYNRLGLIKYLRGRMEEAARDYERSIEYLEEIGDFIEATKPINNLANIYIEHHADREKAMENYKKGLEIVSRYGKKEVEIVFLGNIANIYSEKYEFEEALKYLEGARNSALEIQDLDMTFYSHIRLGSLYLAIGKYSKAFEFYEYVKEVFDSNKIVDMDIIVNYYIFLGELYEYMGQWDDAIKYAQMASDLYKGYNALSYLDCQSRILRCKFHQSSSFQREEVETIRNEYRKTRLILERRRALLDFTIIAFIYGDKDYALKLLREDESLISKYNNPYLDDLRNLIRYFIDASEESIKKLIKLEAVKADNYTSDFKLLINTAIGFSLRKMLDNRSALKYLLESLDIIYRSVTMIPDNGMKISYIRKRKTDLIREEIFNIIEEEFNCTLQCLKSKKLNPSRIHDYFDISSLIDIIGNYDFTVITQLDYYGEVINIDNIETLIAKLTNDFKYNLDLILGYIGKETLAKRGYIIKCDEDTQESSIITYIGSEPNREINKNILKFTDKSRKGYYINSNIYRMGNYGHSEFLQGDVKGVICVPIMASSNNSVSIDRRKYTTDEPMRIGYIFLETDRIFNRFDMERLKVIQILSNLIYINLVNNDLELIATTDKLTGTLTRKYYEGKFERLIETTKVSNGSFSVLMLDIDRFKRVNDSYGHRKGDEILGIIGGILNSSVRSTDIVARYGGEEFIILLKNTGGEEAYSIGEKIRSGVSNYKFPGIEYPITVSIGISLFPQHSQFKEELIEKADQALYYAKEVMGRNNIGLWDEDMDNLSHRVNKLAGILTGNVEADNRNVLALLDIIELIKEDNDLEVRAFQFLGRLLETIEAEQGTIILTASDRGHGRYFTRTRFIDYWVDTPILNQKLIDRVIETKKGEFLIDWDTPYSLDHLSGLPEWKSKIILPLVKNSEVKGILYISASLSKKEFNFDNFNLAKNLANIFASILD